MPPKKKGGDDDTRKADVFTIVEKTFLELKLADCNKKLATYRATVDDFEETIESWEKKYRQLDEDRADVIAYLKKQLGVKTEENQELKEKIKGLEELREVETKTFTEKVNDLENNFKIMKDTLTAENKLLSGKINSLEEFRAIREDLMKKFERQEQAYLDQDMKYKRMLYDADKKFVIAKDKLKKEMEVRLLKLAQDFQDATELRIAASTHRVIRENIAINNELDALLATQSKITEQNERFRDNKNAAQVALIVAEEDRDKAIQRNVLQQKVIARLTSTINTIKEGRGRYEQKMFDLEHLQSKNDKLTKENSKLLFQINILEQRVDATAQDKNLLLSQVELANNERNNLRKVINQTSLCIKSAMKLNQWAIEDRDVEIMNRQVLLSKLLKTLDQAKLPTQGTSIATMKHFESLYDTGDVGLVPKRKSTSATAVTSKRSSEITTMIEASEHEDGSLKKASGTSFESLHSVHTIPGIKVMRVDSVDLPPPGESQLTVFSSDVTLCRYDSSTKPSQTDVDEVAKVEPSKLSQKDEKVAEEVGEEGDHLEVEAGEEEEGMEESLIEEED